MLRLRMVSVGILLVGLIEMGFVPRGVAQEKKEAAPARTAKEYAVRLNLDDAARLHALAALFPDRRIEELVTDLLHAGLDEVAAAMPYVAGPKIISRDDHGDPAYEDIGLTPRFVELTRRFKKDLQAAPAVASTAAPAAKPAKAP